MWGVDCRLGIVNQVNCGLGKGVNPVNRGPNELAQPLRQGINAVNRGPNKPHHLLCSVFEIWSFDIRR